MANQLEGLRRLDDSQHVMSRDTETKSSLLQHHLSLYNDLMKVQPQRHTEQQLKMEREQRRMQILHEEQTELDRIRQKYQVDGASKGGKPYLLETDFESRRREMIIKQRAMEKRRNEEEANNIQEEIDEECDSPVLRTTKRSKRLAHAHASNAGRQGRKDKVVKPKWYEVEYQKKMVDVKSRSEQVWKQGRKTQSYNIWDKRKEDQERHHQELVEMLPKNEADEEEMLRKAIELSRQTAEQSRKEASNIGRKSGTEATVFQTRPYKNRSQLDNIWDIDSDDENKQNLANKHQQESWQVGYATAVKKKGVNEISVPNFIGKSNQIKEQTHSQIGFDHIPGGFAGAEKRSRGRGNLLLMNSTPLITQDSKGGIVPESSSIFTERVLNSKKPITSTANISKYNRGEDNKSDIKQDQNNNDFTATNLQTDSYSRSGEDWNLDCSDWYVYCGPQLDGQCSSGPTDSSERDGSEVNKLKTTGSHPESYTEDKGPSIPSVHSSKGFTDSLDSSSSSETDSDFHFPSVSFVASKKCALNKPTTEQKPLQSVLKKENPVNKEQYRDVYVPLITSVNRKSGKKTVRYADEETKSMDSIYVPIVTNVDVKSGRKTVSFAETESHDYKNENETELIHPKIPCEDVKGIERVKRDSKQVKIYDKKITEGVQREAASCTQQSKSNKENKVIDIPCEVAQTISEKSEDGNNLKSFNDTRNKADVRSKGVPKSVQDFSSSSHSQESQKHSQESQKHSQESQKHSQESQKHSQESQKHPKPEPAIDENFGAGNVSSQHGNISSQHGNVSSQHGSIPYGLPEHMYESYLNYIQQTQGHFSQNQNTSSESLSGCLDISKVDSDQSGAYINPFMNPFILANYYSQEMLMQLMQQFQIGTEPTLSEKHKDEKGQEVQANEDPGKENGNINLEKKQNVVDKSESASGYRNKDSEKGENKIAQEESELVDKVAEDSFVLLIDLKGRLGVCDRNLRMPKFPAVATRLTRKNLISLNIDPLIKSPNRDTSQKGNKDKKGEITVVTDSQCLPVGQVQKDTSKQNILKQSSKQPNNHMKDKLKTDKECGWVETGNVTDFHSYRSDKDDEYNFWGAQKIGNEHLKSDADKRYEVDRSEHEKELNIKNSSSRRPNLSKQFTDNRENLSGQKRSRYSNTVDSKGSSTQSGFKTTLDHNRMIRDAIKEIRKQAKVNENEVTDSGDGVKKLRYF